MTTKKENYWTTFFDQKGKPMLEIEHKLDNNGDVEVEICENYAEHSRYLYLNAEQITELRDHLNTLIVLGEKE